MELAYVSDGAFISSCRSRVQARPNALLLGSLAWEYSPTEGGIGALRDSGRDQDIPDGGK